MRPINAKYHYAPHRDVWGIWSCDGTFVEDLPTKELAKEKVYELNGWTNKTKK